MRFTLAKQRKHKKKEIRINCNRSFWFSGLAILSCVLMSSFSQTKADCEKDGNIYLNGEKLVDPETPCTVCYCQGGEILCSSVTCFHRDDCTPLYIPGRCCPEYDNCPVLSSEAATTTSESIFPLDTSSIKPEIHSAAINPKITIKEITKPIEIRITSDNQNKPSHHKMLKTSTTETSTFITTTNSISSTIPTMTTEANFAVNLTQHASSNHEDVLQLLEIDSSDSNNMNINHEHFGGNAEVADSISVTLNSSNPPELIYSNLQNNNTMRQTSLNSDPDTSGSDNIYHIISTTDGPRFASSEDLLELQGHNSKTNNTEKCRHTKGTKTLQLQINTTSIHNNPEFVVKGTNKSIAREESTIKKLDRDEAFISTECTDSNNTVSGVHYLEDEETPLSMDANPAYPSLPEDDFSLRDVNFPLVETDDVGEVDIKDQSRSINGPFDVTKGIQPLNGDNSDTSNTDSKLLPEVVQLRSKISSGADSLEVLQDTESINKETFGNSSEKTLKEREPTTPIPTRGTDIMLDIDGPGKASNDGDSTVDDPKLDVESLKIEENQDESLVKPDTVNKKTHDSKI